MALAIDIADAVVAELAGGAFSVPITPVRRVLPEYELADLKDLRVTVVPTSVEIEGASRAVCQHDVRVDIGIQKKLGKALDTQVAPLCGLVEEINEFLKRRPLAATPYAVWVRSANEPIYAADHLAEQRAFTSVLSVTYRAMR
ncbi:MAG: hypothetical protein KGY81_04585 [Phycisphaerae bacterium]|nr:hypothetical protein [Phycisphaerae bacterium]